MLQGSVVSLSFSFAGDFMVFDSRKSEGKTAFFFRNKEEMRFTEGRFCFLYMLA